MKKLFEELNNIGCDIDGALARFMGDEELYIECLESFIGDDNIRQLRDLIDTDNYQEMFNCAHTIKGVAANLGLTSLFNSTCVLVELLRSENYTNIKESFGNMNNEYENFVRIFTDNKN